MKRTFRSLTALAAGFCLVMLFGALAYGGTFTTTYKGTTYVIETPHCFPETLTESDVALIQYPGLRLNTILFKYKGLTGFALLIGADVGSDALYPVGAIYTSNVKAKPVMWKYFVYLDHKTPSAATEAKAEAWAQGHKLGKPETLKKMLPELHKRESESRRTDI